MNQTPLFRVIDHRNPWKKQNWSPETRSAVRRLLKAISPVVHGSALPFNKNERKKIPQTSTLQLIHKINHDWHKGVRRICQSGVTDESKISLEEHFERKHLFYFSGNSRLKAAETLFCIDIDCHKSGSLEGAIAFADHLKAKLRRYLHLEISTTESGLHVFVLLRKCGCGPERINQLFERFETWLNREASQFDVEYVEIKGTQTELKWLRKTVLQPTSAISKNPKDHRLGSLCKFPVEIARLHKIVKSEMTVLELERLVGREPGIMDETFEGSGITWKQHFVAKRKGIVEPTEIKKLKAGSGMGGDGLPQEELAALPTYRRIAERFVARCLSEGINLGCKGRKIITAEDVAIFLLVVKWCTQNKRSRKVHQEGGLSVRYIWNCWKGLYHARIVDRSFDPSRFATIRNAADQLKLLDWVDSSFSEDTPCKWGLSAQVMESLDQVVSSRGGVNVRTRIEEHIETIQPKTLSELIRPKPRPIEDLERPRNTCLNNVFRKMTQLAA